MYNCLWNVPHVEILEKMQVPTRFSANWVSFDFNVSYSSCWGHSLINTIKFKNNMKIQVPHFRGGFGITPIAGSAISAFYSATCALVVLLGSHGGTRPAPDFADTWAPGLNLTSPQSFFLTLSLNPHSLTCLRRRLSRCTSTGTLLVFCRNFLSKSL